MLLLDRLERRVLADRQGLIAARAQIDEFPSFDEERDRFDAALAAPPEEKRGPTVSLEEWKLRKALGVA